MNRLRFVLESLKEKESQKGSTVFSDLLVVVSAFYYDSSLKNELPFSFIESIQDNDSINSNSNMNNTEVKDYRIAFEKNINLSTQICFNFGSGNLNSSNIFQKLMNKAQQTSLYLYAVKVQRYCKILDPNWDVVEMKIEFLNNNHRFSSNSEYIIRARMVLYKSLDVTFNCRITTGQFYIESSSFLNTKQIEILNEFIHSMEFKYAEIKTLVQILSTEYFCSEFCIQMKQYFLHVVKSDRMIYHFSIKKAKCMHISRTKNDIWESAQKNLRLSEGMKNKLKAGFYGNHLYVLLSPFDSMVSLPIFNPSSIIKTDKTYNFITIEIPWDFLPKEDPRRTQFTTLPHKMSDIEIKFIYGRIIDQESAELDESYNLLWFEKDLNLNPEAVLGNSKGDTHIIEDLVKELVIYYKLNNQIKSHQTLFSKISQNVVVSQDSYPSLNHPQYLSNMSVDSKKYSKYFQTCKNKFDKNIDWDILNKEKWYNNRILVKDFNFDLSNDFKPLKGFNDIFKPSMLEVRNSCKSWIFNINNDKTKSIMRFLRENLKIDYFKNFLMDVDVSVIIDLK